MYDHDGVGNVINRRKPDGAIVSYSYDVRNRLVQVSYPDGTGKQYEYDKVGNMIGLSNGETSETRQYDPLGRVLLTSDRYLGQLDYGYDLLGNRTTIMDSAGGVMTYEYDANSRVVAFTDPEGGRTSYRYDSMGRIVSTVYPNNTESVQEYDADNNLVSITTYGDREGVVSAFDYTYDAVGNRLTMIDKDGNVTGYRYDAVYQLTGVDYPQRGRESEPAMASKNNGTAQGKGKKNGHFKGMHGKTPDYTPTTVGYVYDAAGNRIHETADGQTTNYSYNAANQLLQAGGARFVYDANGNRIEQQQAGESVLYAYTYDDLLQQVDNPDGQSTGYGYDALNRRVYTVDEKGATRYYLYDGLEVLEEISGRLNQKMAVYYRANGRILTRQEFEVSQGDNPGYQNRPTGRRLYYSYDGLGSTAALTDHNGKLVTSYRYDAYGQLTGGDIRENPYTFTGKRFDEESGLYHFHYRQYDPVVGVWTTPDPIGVLGGVNVYGYVQNDPVNWVDPWGLSGKPGNTALGILFGQVMRGVNTFSPVPLELLTSDPWVKQLIKVNPVTGAVIGELAFPKTLGDGTLENIDPLNWDKNGNGLPDYLEPDVSECK